MLMRPLNGTNAELTGRVSRAPARGVMAEVSAGNYTLSRCILAGLVGERGLNHRRRGHPPPSAGLTARDTPSAPPVPSSPAPPRTSGRGHSPCTLRQCVTWHTRPHACQSRDSAPPSPRLGLGTHPRCAHTLTHRRAHASCSPSYTAHSVNTHGHIVRTHTHGRVHTNTPSHSPARFWRCAAGCCVHGSRRASEMGVLVSVTPRLSFGRRGNLGKSRRRARAEAQRSAGSTSPSWCPPRLPVGALALVPLSVQTHTHASHAHISGARRSHVSSVHRDAPSSALCKHRRTVDTRMHGCT